MRYIPGRVKVIPAHNTVRNVSDDGVMTVYDYVIITSQPIALKCTVYIGVHVYCVYCE